MPFSLPRMRHLPCSLQFLEITLYSSPHAVLRSGRSSSPRPLSNLQTGSGLVSDDCSWSHLASLSILMRFCQLPSRRNLSSHLSTASALMVPFVAIRPIRVHCPAFDKSRLEHRLIHRGT